MKNPPRIEGAKFSDLGEDVCVLFKISYHSDLDIKFVCENSFLSSSLRSISFSGLIQMKIRKQFPVSQVEVWSCLVPTIQMCRYGDYL